MKPKYDYFSPLCLKTEFESNRWSVILLSVMCFYVISSDLSLIFSENLLVILFVCSLPIILLPDHLRLAEIAISKHDKATRELSVLMNNAEKSGIKEKRMEHIRLAEELDSVQEKLEKGITFSMSLSIEFVINFSTLF